VTQDGTYKDGTYKDGTYKDGTYKAGTHRSWLIATPSKKQGKLQPRLRPSSAVEFCITNYLEIRR
jgi:hypothetical protein